MQSVTDILFYLIIYSFLGWICESAYCSVGARKFVNRGFLNGPLCPVYGFGAVLTLNFLGFFKSGILGVFFGGMIITSILEYVTGELLERLFHAKWWDYSDKKFNINGRVCLENSLLFGMLCVLLRFFIHPPIAAFIGELSQRLKIVLLIICGVFIFSDLTVTVRSILGIHRRMEIIANIKKELSEAYFVFNEKMGISEFLSKLSEKAAHDERYLRLREKFSHGSLFERRIIKAFPNYRPMKYKEVFDELKEKLKKYPKNK